MNDITDHLPISTFDLHEVKRNKSKTFVYKRNIEEKSIKMFYNKLRQENWNSVVNDDDVNIAYDNVMKLFLTHYDECCPILKIYFNNKNKSKLCMTTSLKNAYKKETLIHRIYLK